jgi:hypothetical protein
MKELVFCSTIRIAAAPMDFNESSTQGLVSRRSCCITSRTPRVPYFSYHHVCFYLLFLHYSHCC